MISEVFIIFTTKCNGIVVAASDRFWRQIFLEVVELDSRDPDELKKGEMC